MAVDVSIFQTVQVVSGIKRTDRLIVSPSAGILEGQKVSVVQGVPGIAPDKRFRPAEPESASLSAAQRAKVEAAKNPSDE